MIENTGVLDILRSAGGRGVSQLLTGLSVAVDLERAGGVNMG